MVGYVKILDVCVSIMQDDNLQCLSIFSDTNKFVAHVAGLVSLPSFRGLSACGGIFSASTSRKKDIKTNYV